MRKKAHLETPYIHTTTINSHKAITRRGTSILYELNSCKTYSPESCMKIRPKRKLGIAIETKKEIQVISSSNIVDKIFVPYYHNKKEIQVIFFNRFE